ncbi:monosaccharide ABC transporter membrane protein, CUT2 family [Streptomyces sp. DI166]|uniref:ABC transporter permease n=1 Tax=Streptomyces sp. DI166 TaxID=1839783 RepID=UPI0007F55C18|nr:ABC transporter permease [Streptomyces sp. DI166]SBT89972.1 monosaccharide ABC transporter membrane protein, CUT2 family [Streptomyces sp. DI166]
MRTSLRARLTSWDYILAALVVVLLVAASLTQPGFAGGFNFANSVSQMSDKALLVLPLALLIIAREIDISVASVAGLSGVVLGMALEAGGPLPLAITLALLAGTLCGALNGVLVTFVGLPSLVVTLGTLALFRGLCYVLLGGTPITDIPLSLTTFGNETIPRTYVPWDIVPFLVLAPLFALYLHRTAAGRRTYAIGGGPDIARYAGVRLNRIRFGLFVVSGAVAALAGVITVARTSQAAPDGALGFELDAITVVFLGGVSVLGGKGRMPGVCWALVLVVGLRSMLQLGNVSGYAQSAAVGALLILSLLATNTAHRVHAALTRRRLRALAVRESAVP